MSEVQAQALCGKCKVPVQGPDEPADDSVFACRECGRSDTYANILEEVGNHFRDMAALALNAQMERVARSSKMISVTGFEVQPREYRFISSVEP